jgi:hypothetical protein
MATPGQKLVIDTTNNCNLLVRQLEAVRTTVDRIVQQMEATGLAALDDYVFPDGYTKADLLALYFMLAGKQDDSVEPLPGSVVSDDVRDAIHKLINHVQ